MPSNTAQIKTLLVGVDDYLCGFNKLDKCLIVESIDTSAKFGIRLNCWYLSKYLDNELSPGTKTFIRNPKGHIPSGKRDEVPAEICILNNTHTTYGPLTAIYVNSFYSQFRARIFCYYWIPSANPAVGLYRSAKKISNFWTKPLLDDPAKINEFISQTEIRLREYITNGAIGNKVYCAYVSEFCQTGMFGNRLNSQISVDEELKCIDRFYHDFLVPGKEGSTITIPT